MISLLWNMARNLAAQKTFPPESVTCVGTTGIELDRISFLWTVEKYSFLKHLGELKSPVFQGGPKFNHSWQLSMSPNEDNGRGQCFHTIALILVDYGDRNDDNSASSSVKAHFQYSILNQEGVRAVPAVRSSNSPGLYQIFEKGVKSIEYILIFVEDLLSTDMGLVVDDSFTILCEIWIHGEMKQRLGNGRASRLGPSEEERTKIWEASLVSDFGKLFKESIGSDVTVETTNASFKAHKVVLMVRSPVFAAMFNAKMKEKEESRVQITDFDDKVVKGMLEHLYTGKTDCMAKRAEDLLKISDKYDLPSLKKDCEFVIADRLRKENAAVTLILAHSHNALYLKQKAVDFINMHKEDLLKSKSFLEAVKAHDDVGLLIELYSLQ